MKFEGLPQLLKRTAVSTIVVTTLTFGTVSADSGFGINKVYHVYVNNERIGIVDNKDVVEQYIEDREKALLEKNPNISFGLQANVQYIEEKVFRANVNNQQVLQLLSEQLKIEANAFSVVVNDEPVAFLDSMESAEAVIKNLKLKYVSDEVLAELEARDPNATLPELAEGQSRILDVTFNEKVTISEQKVSPEEILSVGDAVTYLLMGALEEKKYQVQEGDVLGSIASAHNLSLDELLALNEGFEENSVIKVGQEINVTALKPFLNVLIQEEVYKRESIPFGKKITENKEMPKGENKVTQKGKNGEKLVNYIVSKQNGRVVEQKTTREKVVMEPVTELVDKGTKVIPSRGTGSFAWPAVGGYISSYMGYRWGRMHKGIDIARPSNRNILSADNGTVTQASYDGGYGNRIVVNHNNGITTTYSHLSSMSVGVGQTVQRGQKIGVMGATGNSTGVHLHFEVYKNGALQNPMHYLGK
ncbi:M23 family metallopeptidase [Bacillus mesophilus]|uniref:M23 family metallopeptidase n=2 Tax=Bacillus mesophilus TaxID=1808955 RepID=A0A6M0Q9T9_9BACI|nr:M23 family metallopeptidase [Bacillus mesophilus]NEY73124.1 M23 family metallopeptidase [Bacillus mesophilus]